MSIKEIHEAKWPQAKREAYHAEHPERFAGPGLSFPIQDAEDVAHAASLHGQADDPEAVKAKIKHIAKSLNLSSALPQEWSEDNDPDDDNDEGDDDDTDAQDPCPGDEYDSYGNIKEAVFSLEGQILEQKVSKSGHEVRVTVIKGGRSKNGFAYDQPTLKSLARMLEGAQAYADHDVSVAVRSVRDLVGFYKNATYMPPDGDNPDGRVDATLHILEQAEWLWSMIHEAVSIGKPELIGLSVDIFGKWQQSDGAKQVTSITQINSCDIVTRPSAGGEFQRILQSLQKQSSLLPPTHTPQGAIMPDKKTTIPTDPANPPVLPAANPEQRITENTPPASPPVEASTAEDGRILEARQLAEETKQALAEMRAEQGRMALERAQLQLDRRLLENILPEPVKATIRERFRDRIFEQQELDTEFERQRSMMAQLTQAGLITGHGYEKPTVGGQITEAEKIQAAIDLMFEDDKIKMLSDTERAKFSGIRPFSSIREAYVRATGDAAVSGAQGYDLGTIRVSEHAPIGRITEADTTTASFSYLLGTSMNKRLLKDYQAWPAEWAKFCTVVPIKDFKQQTRVRLGAFGSLSTVPEDTTYTTLTLQDSAATYVPTKRGNLVTVSRETIINDDLFAIKQIPTKLAVAAAYTLAEFVYAFLSANPNIYDGNALFTSGAPHSNLGSANLSSASMQTGVTAMREQTNFAGKRIGVRPKYLVVPPELEFVAIVVTRSAGVPGSTNNDVNPMLGYVQPIVSPQLSNTTQWFFAADPMVIDTIEIGFVGGQVNPALFVQDQPLFGLNFTNDVISYKVRHEYGGTVVDYRGLYRGV